VNRVEVAPHGCIVCGVKPEEGDGKAWVYIAGSWPIGAMAFDGGCMLVALRRMAETGRVDDGKAKS